MMGLLIETYKICLVFVLISVLKHSTAYKTNIWYSGSTSNNNASRTNYDTVIYANMTVKINQPYEDGPGNYLISDSDNSTNVRLFVGNTINRQAFETQFVLDMQYTLGKLLATTLILNYYLSF